LLEVVVGCALTLGSGICRNC